MYLDFLEAKAFHASTFLASQVSKRWRPMSANMDLYFQSQIAWKMQYNPMELARTLQTCNNTISPHGSDSH